MNYYIDLIPNIEFLNRINDKISKDNNVIFNIYIKQLPSMAIYEELYMDIEDAIKMIKEIRLRKRKVNVIFDIFCFGNREFTKQGKKVFKILDKLLEQKIDYITITNDFFLKYIKGKKCTCKIIESEYSNINNMQKINRYLRDLSVAGVKIDMKLANDLEQMKIVKEKFPLESIHINVNKEFYEDDIYIDALNNSLSHYIIEGEWDTAKETIKKYKKINKNKHILRLTDDKYKRLKLQGYNNFWFSYSGNKEQYLVNEIEKKRRSLKDNSL